MSRILALMLPPLALAACNSSPKVEASNATSEEVAAKVESSGVADRFISPGQWRMTMKVNDVSMPGLPPEAAAHMKETMGQGRVFTNCVTPEEAKRPGEGMFAGDDNSCRYEKFSMGGGKIDMTMRCGDGNTARVMDMTGTYGPNDYQMKVASRATGESGPAAMSMQMEMVGKRIGECTAAQIADEAKG